MARKPHILFVDEDRKSVEYYRKFLEEQHFTVRHVTSGVDALAEIRAKTPALIISELPLPDLNGLDFCRKLRSNPEFFHLPFVLLSKFRGVTDESLATEAGVDLFLGKPISPKQLQHHIDSLLGRKELQSDHDALNDSSFKGRLDDIPVPELVQLVDRMAKTGRLVLRNGKLTGEIHFHKGQVYDSIVGGERQLEHLDAFCALVFLEKGRFFFDSGFTPLERFFKESTSTLLLQAFVQRDHENRDAANAAQAASQDGGLPLTSKSPDSASEPFLH